MDNNEENENEVKPIHENVRVLVVDDSEFARKQITNIVENLGLTVAGEASTPSESIEAIARTKANLIVVDVVMPEMNGIELTKNLLEKFNNIYIIMVSSLCQENIILDSIAAGAMDFIQKPFEGDTLKTSLVKIAAIIEEESNY
ncbi:MAG: response regulator [Bacteriovoracaceae bacterium]|jgi:two-component system, chemotaxis family, chemotaxis protein CheY|nr:response regulator [Bacteriovoracaceae bacterium]